MPTIEISNETLEFLRSCKNELLTQDNRCTANVIFFNEYEDRSYADYQDGYHSDGYIWFDSNWDSPCETDEELFEYLESCDSENFAKLEKIYEYDVKDMLTTKKPTMEAWFLDILKDNQYDSNFLLILYDNFSDIDFREVFEINDFVFDDEFRYWHDIHRISYNKEFKPAESGLFSFFESDIAEHKRLDGHNYRSGQHSYGGSIQRSPKMLQLLELLTTIELPEDTTILVDKAR
jgi:hypothetical protein